MEKDLGFRLPNVVGVPAQSCAESSTPILTW